MVVKKSIVNCDRDIRLAIYQRGTWPAISGDLDEKQPMLTSKTNNCDVLRPESRQHPGPVDGRGETRRKGGRKSQGGRGGRGGRTWVGEENGDWLSAKPPTWGRAAAGWHRSLQGSSASSGIAGGGLEEWCQSGRLLRKYSYYAEHHRQRHEDSTTTTPESFNCQNFGYVPRSLPPYRHTLPASNASL